MTAAMTSPHFPFRVERDPHPRSAEIHPLAPRTRDASPTPVGFDAGRGTDALADAGTLDVPATLAAQVPNGRSEVARLLDCSPASFRHARATTNRLAYFPDWTLSSRKLCA